MRIYGIYELLVSCDHADKYCGHKHYDVGDIVFLVCHVTSRKHMIKGLCEFMIGNPSR